MKRNLVIASLIVFAISYVGVTPSASAQDCNPPAILKDLLKKFNEQCKQREGADAKPEECVEKPPIYAQLINAWNSLVGPDSPAVVGPRRINFRPQGGKLVVPGGRIFYSPPLDSDSVTVEIKKLSGRAAADIRVCKVTTQGASTTLDSFSFAESDAEGKVIKKTYSGLAAHALQMAMQAKGGLLRHFEFTLTVTKNNR